MSFQEFLPDARLQPLVRSYWQVSEYHDVSQQEHRFLPERSVRLTFYAGQSWQASTPLGELEPMPQAVLFGLTLTPQRVVSVGLTRALGVELYPWGARQLFGWEFGQYTLDLSRDHPWLCRAVCALIALNAWDEARQMVEEWLLSLLSQQGQALQSGAQAAIQLYRSLGSARIGTLATELNLSQRHLERLFVQEVGVNAKTLARLIRFEEIHNRLWLDPYLPLAPLAYDLGFADQAHLTREFRTLADMTPRKFAQSTLLRVRTLTDAVNADRLLTAASSPADT
ncbi:helix-turn-helix domain-containing protein [Deinococcus sp. KNUC1210]|uniref:AraC family transcriptional regulator n=1 Tax=Deinococcus sp. KNUC1210 TaxID=2917691 RepID=UPI001EEFAB01|nr:helix-turn-helix domain-containing protein [Deinococcus sp. KNUC1210]ULH15007.1 helix-turn-helix domain-containing protein [Deinococcus sp. KNUC1210]